MKLAVIGAGRLGLPIALCFAQKHQVSAFDPGVSYPGVPHLTDPQLLRERGPTGGDDFQTLLDLAMRTGRLRAAATLSEAVKDAEIIFVIVQTPHAPEFEGTQPLPDSRADFDYTYLKDACRQLAGVPLLPSQVLSPEQIVVIVSTVLPGTTRREILPILAGRCRVCYNPAFPAMGTVMQDFMNPEFVLLGADDSTTLDRMGAFYQDFYGDEAVWRHRMPMVSYKPSLDIPIRTMSIESAEITKVLYNLYVSTKVGFSSAVLELCHKVPGCDADDVTNALKQATKRLISPAYLVPGGLEGGGCHPRDAIAMSWLARKINLSYDPFGSLMEQRERVAGWLVHLVLKEACGGLENWKLQRFWDLIEKPIVLLGKAYKPESAITTGSAALLIANLFPAAVKDRIVQWDPYVDGPWTAEGDAIYKPSTYLICTKHAIFKDFPFPPGSVVVDPFRFIPDREGVKVVRIGENKCAK